MARKATQKKLPVALIVVCAVLVALAAFLIVFREPVRCVFYSNVDPRVKLDVEGEWANGTAYKNVQYSEISTSDYLNLYVPSVENPPLIVAIHGGGFVLNDCESRQAQLFYQYFRDHGYAVATVNYRLAQEASFPGALQDVKAAVRYLRANAETYGYNAEKIAVWGESAGGYLAVMTAVTNDDEFNDVPFIGEDALSEPVSARVSVLLDYYGAVQLETRAERVAAFKQLGIPELVVKIASGWLDETLKGTPYETCEDYWIGASLASLSQEEKNAFTPAYYVRKNLPGREDLDALICHGDADITVPMSQSLILYEEMLKTIGDARTQLHLVHNCGHAGEKLFNDENLGAVRAFLEKALAR